MTYNMDSAQRSGYRETELGWLPEEWEVGELGEIGKFQYGYTESASSNEIGPKFLRITDIDLKTSRVVWETVPHCKIAPEKFSKYILRNGDVLIARIGATTGKTCIIKEPPKSVFASYLIRFTSDCSKVFPEYTYYFTLSDWYWKQIDAHKEGKLKKGVSVGQLKDFQIPLPPLPEQRKIAAVLAAIQETRDRTEQVITALQAFKKSLMKHLFTYGPVRVDEVDQVRLQETEIGMMPEGWEIAPLKEVCEKIQDGTHFSPKAKKDGEVMYITSKNIRPFRLDLASVEFIDEVDHRKIYRRCDVKKGDLLFTKDGVNTGNCVVNPLEEEFSLLSSVCLIRPIPNLLNHFLCQYINSPEGRSLIRSSMAGSAITRLTVKKIVNITVPVPPLPVQHQIAAILSAVDEKIEKEENTKNALNSFFLSMLHELMTAKIRVYDLDITT